MIEDMKRGITPFEGEVKRNYLRNIQMIDLARIPTEVRDSILDQYQNYERKDRSLLLNYFIKNKLKNLMSEIQEF